MRASRVFATHTPSEATSCSYLRNPTTVLPIGNSVALMSLVLIDEADITLERDAYGRQPGQIQAHRETVGLLLC